MLTEPVQCNTQIEMRARVFLVDLGRAAEILRSDQELSRFQICETERNQTVGRFGRHGFLGYTDRNKRNQCADNCASTNPPTQHVAPPINDNQVLWAKYTLRIATPSTNPSVTWRTPGRSLRRGNQRCGPNLHHHIGVGKP